MVLRGGEKIIIGLDPADLNKAVEREQYPIPAVEEIAVKTTDASVYSHWG